MRSTTTLPNANLIARVESPLGEIVLTSRAYKLTGLFFADRPRAPMTEQNWKEQPDAAIFIRTVRQLEEYAAGKRKNFDLPIGFGGTSFQAQVWTQISAIPFGQTITYTDLARRTGSAQAIRAVGAAAAANPLCWIIPCHRVVGVDGDLTGYAGGLPRKIALLDFEAGKTDHLVFPPTT